MKKTTVIEQLEKHCTKAISSLGLINEVRVGFEHPADPTHGDYSTNLAMVHFKDQQQYKSPRDFAQAIVNSLDDSQLISKVEVAGSGFINFTLSDSFLLDDLKVVLKTGDSPKPLFLGYPQWQDKKIMVEFTDPNPFKEFHIGHLYSNIVGESLSRLFEAVGAIVKRVNYQGDVGMHVAKSVWGMLEKMKQDDLQLSDLAKWKDATKRIRFLGQSYSLGATAYEDNQAAQQAMKDLNYLLYLSGQEHLQAETGWEPQVDYQQYLQQSQFDYELIKEVYLTGRQWSLDYFEKIYQRLGTKFEEYFFESLVGEIGAKLVKENIAQGVFVESEGAIIFEGEKHGLHNRVFINSFGLPTYESKDLGLSIEKYNKWHYDYSFIITGNEIDEYFKVVLTALKEIKPDLANKTVHLSHGMVRLPAGKMSSRTGKILTAEWMLNQAAQKALEKIQEETQAELLGQSQIKSNPKARIKADQISDIAEDVGQGAIKFALLSNSLGKDISFDFDTSLSFQGFSGPYLQYTHARCKSVMAKGKKAGLVDKNMVAGGIELNHEERQILRQLYQFEEKVVRAVELKAPHIICTYLFDLAQAYNTFYNKHSILKAKEAITVRLNLTEATAIVLQQGLSLIGVKAPDKM